MLNHIDLIGRMVRDPEMKALDSGTSFCNFAIAVEADFKENGEKVTDFFECTAWRQKAEFIARYITKGDTVAVSGQMRSRKWTDRDGNRRTSWYVNCENVYSVGQKKPEDTAGQAKPAVPQFVRIDEDDASLPF